MIDPIRINTSEAALAAERKFDQQLFDYITGNGPTAFSGLVNLISSVASEARRIEDEHGGKGYGQAAAMLDDLADKIDREVKLVLPEAFR